MNRLTRQRKTKEPCPICRLHRERCICAQIPRLDLRTRVTLIVHTKELKRTTNTGRLALHALPNSCLVVRGEGRERTDLSGLLTDDYQTLLLYPGEDSIDLCEFKLGSKPIQLLVPDGNWRQAGKVAIRHPELASVPRVKISLLHNPDAPRMRREPVEGGMSTLEAIAYAMTQLEGELAGQSLLALYQAKLHATLKGRPQPF